MDELLVTGVVALVVFYAGIVIAAYGIIEVLLGIASAVLAGNYGLFALTLAGVVCVIVAYFAIGLCLRRVEII